MIIPIGIQCLNKELKKTMNKDTQTMPFDWMLSNPKFVFVILNLLLEYEIDVEEIVNNHFFNCNKRASLGKLENYYTNSNGSALYNDVYDVIFPHDVYNNETKEKYVRRLKRLKSIILDSKENLIFIYSSQSSLQNGNFLIDDRYIIEDVYIYLTKIYELIGKYNTNYKMVVFDAILNEDKSNLHKNIILKEMTPCSNWGILLRQILQYRDILL